jgi:hypothetical protein
MGEDDPTVDINKRVSMKQKRGSGFSLLQEDA